MFTRRIPSGLLLPLWAFVLLAVFILSAVVRADGPSISAMLSSATATVGEAVELQVVISGVSNASAPDIRVDGVRVQYGGASTSVQIVNTTMTQSVTHNYTLIPQRAGTFTIPSIIIDISGKKFTTSPMTLSVSGQGQPNPAPGQPVVPGQPAAPGSPATPPSQPALQRLYFAEWVLAKTTAYVGEAIPAELRLYVDSQVRWGIQQMPNASGDGFILQKFPQPRKATAQRDGRTYDILVFKSALIPAKAGKLTLPATDIDFIATVPQKRQRRSNLPRMPGFPDMFNDPFFDNAFNFQQQQVKTQTTPVELEIKPLPLAGRPKHFSGAVGTFTMTTGASPARVKAGDPITVTCTISGIGSFDRMEAPYIAEEPGWRAYPPSAKFKANDEVNVSGSKTFETALIADSAKDRLPKIEFTFFDPDKEKYVTLADESNLITVDGTVAAPTPAVASQPNAAAPAATPQPKVTDIFYIQTENTGWGLVFEPAWRTRGFWLTQLLLLVGFVGLQGWRIQHARLNDQRLRRAAALRETLACLLKALRQQPMSPGEFYDSAMRVLQIEAALTSAAIRAERDPATIDAETACASLNLQGETAAEVHRLFAAHDEVRYAGSGGNGETISPERREAVLKTLERFEKSHV